MNTLPSGQFTQTPGTLYREGYASRRGADTIERLMRQARTQLLDIRRSPRSRWHPTWNRRALETTYGNRYRWDGRLGNLNYRDHKLPIVLADPQGCHRTTVAKGIQDAMSKLLYPQRTDGAPLMVIDSISPQTVLDLHHHTHLAEVIHHHAHMSEEG
jgi:hypothetical protein